MAEGEPDVKAGGDLKSTLTRKIGPLPLYAWVGLALVIFYFVSKQNKAGKGDGSEIDPAGNVGTIDPTTGYVYGSAEDRAALGGGSESLGTSSDSGTGGSTVAGQYADNNAWAVAAINYLVSIGVDAVEANSAITQFLASQTLTAQQQADVNLVIQRIGAPPSPPEPGNAPGPIVQPPHPGKVYATNPPSGFAVTHSSPNSIGVKWNATTNAASYTLSWSENAKKVPYSSGGGKNFTTVSTTAATATGLKPNTLYHLQVQANPAKSGAPFASMTKMTPKGTSTIPKPSPPPTPPSGHGGGPYRPPTKSGAPTAVTVKRGDTFSGIAASHGYKPGGIALWKYNYTSSPHSAQAKAKIKQRGPDLVYAGETVYVPRS